MKCPKCGSENTQRVEVIYESCTSGVNAGSGVDPSGADDGHLSESPAAAGAWRAEMARKTAPPKKEPIASSVGIFIGAMVGIDFILAMTAGMLKKFLSVDVNYVFGLLIILSPLVLLLLLAVKEFGNRKKHSAMLRKWKNGWMCRQCGCVYENQ